MKDVKNGNEKFCLGTNWKYVKVEVLKLLKLNVKKSAKYFRKIIKMIKAHIKMTKT